MFNKSIQYVLFTDVTLFALTIGIIYPIILLNNLNIETSFLGYVVAVFNFGEFIGSFLLSRVYNYLGEKKTFIINLIIAIIGNIIYSHSILINADKARWMILCGRFFLGFYSGGSQSIRQIFISKNIENGNEKLQYIIKLGIFLRFGFIVGPFITIFLKIININLGYVNIIPETAGNYILIILEFLQILLLLYSFHNYQNDQNILTDIVIEKDEIVREEIIFNWYGIIICLILVFTSFLVFSFQETIIINIFIDNFNWTSTEFGYVFTYSGILNAIISLGLYQYCKRNQINNIKMLIISCLFGMVGFILMLKYSKEYNMWLFLFGFTIMTIQTTFSISYIYTSYPKYIKREKLTKYFGYLFMCGSIARIIGGYLFVYLYLNTFVNLSFIIMFVLFSINLLLLLLLKKKI